MRARTFLTLTAAAVLVAAPALAGERHGRQSRDPYAGYNDHRTRVHQHQHQRADVHRQAIGGRTVTSPRDITSVSPRVIPNRNVRITREGDRRHFRADRLGQVSQPYRTDGQVPQTWADRYRERLRFYDRFDGDKNGAYVTRNDAVRRYHADRIHGLSGTRYDLLERRPYNLRYDRMNDRWYNDSYDYDYHVRPYPFRSHFDRHHRIDGLRLHLHYGSDVGTSLHGSYRFHNFHNFHGFDKDRFDHDTFKHPTFRHHRSFRHHTPFRHNFHHDSFRDHHKHKHDRFKHRRHHKDKDGLRLHLNF